MDEADFQILLALHRDPFASFASIGRGNGLSGVSVRNRYERLISRGVLRGFSVLPAPATLGRVRHIHAVAAAGVDPALDRLIAPDDVVMAWRGAPGMVMLTSYDRPSKERPTVALERLLGRSLLTTVAPDPPTAGSPVKSTLSSLDWRVIGALLDAPRSSMRELAAATHLTARTTRRHRDRLLARRLLEIAPIVDTSREPGLVVFSGYVGVEHPADIDAFELPEVGVVWRHHDPPAVAFLGRTSTYGEVLALEQRLRNARGVTTVVITVPRGGAVATSRLKTWIREEQRRWRAFRRSERRQGQRQTRRNQGSRRTLPSLG